MDKCARRVGVEKRLSTKEEERAFGGNGSAALFLECGGDTPISVCQNS